MILTPSDSTKIKPPFKASFMYEGHKTIVKITKINGDDAEGILISSQVQDYRQVGRHYTTWGNPFKYNWTLESKPKFRRVKC